MMTRPMLAAWLMSGQLAFATPAVGDELAALLRAHQYAKAEQVADERLRHDPADVAALAAKAEAIGASRADEAVDLAQQCVRAHPQASICYLALGNALGLRARHANPMAAMRYAGEIRDAFLQAVRLDPHNTDARFALLDYYLQAPALVGGGKARARELAAQTEAINPSAAQLMQAQIDLANGDTDKAEAAIVAVAPGDDEMVADRERELFDALSRRYEHDRRPADSARIQQIERKRFAQTGAETVGSP